MCVEAGEHGRGNCTKDWATAVGAIAADPIFQMI